MNKALTRNLAYKTQQAVRATNPSQEHLSRPTPDEFHGMKYLGNGVFRAVYDAGDFVVKVPRSGSGAEMNIIEYRMITEQLAGTGVANECYGLVVIEGLICLAVEKLDRFTLDVDRHDETLGEIGKHLGVTDSKQGGYSSFQEKWVLADINM